MKKFSISIGTRTFLEKVAREIEWNILVETHENNGRKIKHKSIKVDGHRFQAICKRVPVYKSKKLNLILKRPALILNEKTPKSVRIPTIEINGLWVVQPIANLENNHGALAILTAVKGLGESDLHLGNVGWYDGKPVMFDW